MKLLTVKILFIITGIITMIFSCDNGNSLSSKNQCIKGMFIGYYCDGCVIKILDTSGIGKSWKATYGTDIFENSVVASLDSNYVKSISGIEKYLTPKSIFYFQYIEGGYPRKQYNICEPSPFITITSLSFSPCPNNNLK